MTKFVTIGALALGMASFITCGGGGGGGGTAANPGGGSSTAQDKIVSSLIRNMHTSLQFTDMMAYPSYERTKTLSVDFSGLKPWVTGALDINATSNLNSDGTSLNKLGETYTFTNFAYQYSGVDPLEPEYAGSMNGTINCSGVINNGSGDFSRGGPGIYTINMQASGLQAVTHVNGKDEMWSVDLNLTTTGPVLDYSNLIPSMNNQQTKTSGSITYTGATGTYTASIPLENSITYRTHYSVNAQNNSVPDSGIMNWTCNGNPVQVTFTTYNTYTINGIKHYANPEMELLPH